MSDYSNTIIYRIFQKDDETECYVGSSVEYKARKSKHRSICNNPNSNSYNFPVYQFIRAHGGWENFECDIIEEYPCLSKTEKLARERYWVKLVGTLNSNIPGRSQKDTEEYYKEYSKDNKERISKCKKDYYEANKETTLKNNYEYKQRNKEKLKKQGKEKIACPCGSSFQRYSKAEHERSLKHQAYLETCI